MWHKIKRQFRSRIVKLALLVASTFLVGVLLATLSPLFWLAWAGGFLAALALAASFVFLVALAAQILTVAKRIDAKATVPHPEVSGSGRIGRVGEEEKHQYSGAQSLLRQYGLQGLGTGRDVVYVIASDTLSQQLKASYSVVQLQPGQSLDLLAVELPVAIVIEQDGLHEGVWHGVADESGRVLADELLQVLTLAQDQDIPVYYVRGKQAKYLTAVQIEELATVVFPTAGARGEHPVASQIFQVLSGQ